jgi:hypothetical protein
MAPRIYFYHGSSKTGPEPGRESGTSLSPYSAAGEIEYRIRRITCAKKFSAKLAFGSSECHQGRSSRSARFRSLQGRIQCRSDHSPHSGPPMAPQVAFRRLNGNMPLKELDLFRSSAGHGEPMFAKGFRFAKSFTMCPTAFSVTPLPQGPPDFSNSTEDLFRSIPGAFNQVRNGSIHQPGTGTVWASPVLHFRTTTAYCSSRCSKCSILRLACP